MKNINPKERFYRNIIDSSRLKKYEVKVEETDLLVFSEKYLDNEIKREVMIQRQIIKNYIHWNPEFYTSFSPVVYKSQEEIIKLMCLSAEMTQTGPMASVAGAIAEVVGKKLLLPGEFFIENGGDIYARIDREFIVGVYAGTSPFSMKVGIKLKGSNIPVGIATSSGSVGHSFSYGNADAVTVISRSATFSDGAATYFGNIVKGSIEQKIIEEELRRFPFVEGLLIIKGEEMFLWGEMELVSF